MHYIDSIFDIFSIQIWEDKNQKYFLLKINRLIDNTEHEFFFYIHKKLLLTTHFDFLTVLCVKRHNYDFGQKKFSVIIF